MIHSIPQLVRRAIRRRKALQTRTQALSPVRHCLLAEPLEQRVLLAADLSPLQNPVNRYDTNLDGRVNTSDVATVISDLVTHGNRAVNSAGLAEGETAGLPKLVDVNGDGAINNNDVVAVIRRVMEGAPDPRAQFFMQLTHEDGTPITDVNGNILPGQSVSVGETVFAKISVQDLDTLLSDRVIRVLRPSSGTAKYNDGQTITVTSPQGTRVFELEVPDAPNFVAGVSGTNIAVNFTHTEGTPTSQIIANDSARLAGLLRDAINGQNFGVTTSVEPGNVDDNNLRALLKFQGETNVSLGSTRGFALSSERGLTAAFLDLSYNANLAVFEDYFTLPNDPFSPPPNPTFFMPSNDYYALAWNTELPQEGQPDERYPMLDLASRRINDLGGVASTSASSLAVRLDDPVGDGLFLVTTVAFTVQSATFDAEDDDFTASPIGIGATNVELDVLENDTLPVVDLAGSFSDGAVPTAVYTPYPGTEQQLLTNEEIIFPTASAPIGGSSISFTVVGISQGALSQVTIDQKGTTGDITDDVLRFTPAAGVEGDVEIRYRLTNTVNSQFSEATVTVSVAEGNDAPINTIPTVAISTPEGTDFAFSTASNNRLAISDSDAGEETMSVELKVAAGTLIVTNTSGVTVSGNNSGTVTIQGGQTAINTVLNNGNVIYRPVAEVASNTNVLFTMTTRDNGNTGSGGEKSDVDTFNITVLAVNDAPVNSVPTTVQSVEANEGGPSPATLVFQSSTGNGISVSDVDTTNLTVQLSVAPATGSGPVGILTLGSTPNGVTVSGNNSASITISGPQSALNTAMNGLRFTPAANFEGSVNLTVNTSDGGSQPDTDVVSILVEAQDVLRARPDTATTSEGNSVELPDVLSNDAPSPGATLIFGGFSTPAKGGTLTEDDGTWTYTPPEHFFGRDTFTYLLSDTSGKTATGTVVVTVTEINDPPIANNDSGGAALKTLEGTPLNIPFSALLGNDTVSSPADPFELNPDPTSSLAGQTLTITNVAAAAGGTANASVSLDAANNRVVVTPTGDSNGTFVFTYTARDNGTTNGVNAFLTSTATVTVTIAPVNDAPTAQNKSLSTPEDTNLEIPAATLTSGATPGGGSDESGQTFTVLSVGQPASGGTTSFSNGVVTFDPADNFNGTVTFTYTIQDNGTTDGANDFKTATATVTVSVTEVNDAPIALSSPSGSAVTNQTVTFDANLLLSSAVVSPGPANEASQTLRITNAVLVTPTNQAGSSVQVINNGTAISFLPPTGFDGTATIRYTVTDNGTTNGAADPKSVDVTLNVNVLNFKPTTVGGRVYLDGNLDAFCQDTELGMGNVELILTGRDATTNTNITPRSFFTNADGSYSFTGIAPGQYTVTLVRPPMMLDGADQLGAELKALNGGEIAQLGSNSFTFTITLNGNVSRTDNEFGGNNFSLRGVDPEYLSLLERRSPLPKDGLLVLCDDSGSTWYLLLGNKWNGTTGIEATLTDDGNPNTPATISLTIKTSGGEETESLQVNYRSVRIMGSDGNGHHLLRLEGTAEDIFGLGVFDDEDDDEDAEGESLAASEYSDGVDQLMASGHWLA